MNSPPQILIADDEEDARWALSAIVRQENMRPLEAENGREALERTLAYSPDVVLLDVRMPDMDGISVLKELRKSDLNTPVIMITAHGSIEKAVTALKCGAYGYITKPLDNDDVVRTIRAALRERAFASEVQRQHPSHPLHRTMGSSRCVARLAEQVERVANTNLTVMITGESGVGKELVARAIHDRSRRASSKFVALDCGSLPEGLVENELFGHEDGAYTGAGTARPGKFEAASGGSLLLDEIGNLPFSAQAALLRTLQERKVCRVGGVELIPVDVRLLAATNQNIASLIQAGSFRADLYYRLVEFELHIPPLRDRKEDVPFLAKRFLRQANEGNALHVQGLSERTLSLLQAYDWPGNARELCNVIRRAAILADTVIEPKHLPARLTGPGVNPAGIETEAQTEPHLSLREVSRGATREAERRVLTEVLRRTGGNKAKAARILQVDYKTLHSKVKQYGIDSRSDI